MLTASCSRGWQGAYEGKPFFPVSLSVALFSLFFFNLPGNSID
jgi:hypothetical protein